VRVALKNLEELIKKEKVITAILPTAYGKSSFFKQNRQLLDEIGKTIHVLPLQAIVSDLYDKMKGVFGDELGYQMSLLIPKGVKRPFLSRKYMITTVDSFILDFYGIPVHELYRSKWHSDIAMLFTKASNIILDEYHLMVTLDSDDVASEFTKIITAVEKTIEYAKRKVIIFTATLPKSLARGKTLVLAPDGHPFLTSDMIQVWDNKDEFISSFSTYTYKVKTYFTKKDKVSLIKEVLKNYKDKKILIMLNHIKDVENLGSKFEEFLFIHGLFTQESKERFVSKMKEAKFIISTQVIEAGVDISFDILITDVAPAFSLIQRAGRILRQPEEFNKKDMGEIYILVENIDEQIKGVYDLEMTQETLKVLLGNKQENGNVEINWRLAETDNYKLDYLKLLLSLENKINNILSSNIGNRDIEHFLNLLTNIHLTPQKIIGGIDNLFAGSFIRSSALIPAIIRNENVEEHATLSWPRFQRLLTLAKKLRFSYNVIKGEKEDTKEIEIEKSEIIDEMPLVSIRRVINKIRKEEKELDEDLSGYIKIIPNGFVIPKDFIGVEEREGDKFYYVKGI
jgi:CRISPR-associated endonuclease/helicase Cas3